MAQLLTAVGRLKLDEKKVADSLRELRAAVQRLPNDLTAQTALGQALWQSGESQAALAVLNGVLTQDGDTPEALRTRGEILADLGKVAPAATPARSGLQPPAL